MRATLSVCMRSWAWFRSLIYLIWICRNKCISKTNCTFHLAVTKLKAKTVILHVNVGKVYLSYGSNYVRQFYIKACYQTTCIQLVLVYMIWFSHLTSGIHRMLYISKNRPLMNQHPAMGIQIQAPWSLSSLGSKIWYDMWKVYFYLTSNKMP